MATGTAIGFDIGASSIKMTEISVSRRGASITRFLNIPLDINVMVDEEVGNFEYIINLITNVISSMDAHGADAYVSVKGKHIAAKRVIIPARSKKELQESLLWDIWQYSPFKGDEYVHEYTISDAPYDKKRSEITLFSARKESIINAVALVAAAKLNVVSVEPESMALARLYSLGYSTNSTIKSRSDFAAKGKQSAVIACLGHKTTTYVFVQKDTLLLTLTTDFGGSILTNSLCDEIDLTLEEAIMAQVNSNVIEEEVERIDALKEEFFEAFVKDLQTVITKNNEREKGSKTNVGFVYLTGRPSTDANMVNSINEKIDIPVEMFDPVLGIPKLSLPDEYNSNTFDVSLGLALKKMMQ